MPGAKLSLDKVKELLDDARESGIEVVRLYGGEPLLHPDLAAMIRHGVQLGLSIYVTTNGLLLKQKIESLYEAGLRNITIGFYGTGSSYDSYVHRSDAFRRVEEGVAIVHRHYGGMSMQLNFLIMQPSCNSLALREAWAFATRYDMSFHTDLIHYSLPYFTEGVDRELQFTVADEQPIRALVDELIDLKSSDPHRMTDSMASLRSIPDWLLKGPGMRVPCDAHRMIWVGANGAVQLCYVTFHLGNIYETRLRNLLFTEAHNEAARNAFTLNCPNCHCERNSRIQKHLPSLYKYAIG